MSSDPQPEAKPALPLGHLFAVYSQPSSHQAILLRQLKGLQDVVPMTIMHPVPSGEKRWHVTSESDARFPECNGSEYATAQFRDPPYLVDEQTLYGVAAGNMKIMATFNSATAAAASAPDYNPAQLQQQIQQQCEGIQRDVVDNIKACGDADSQETYEAACTALFVALDRLDEQLSNQRYLVDNRQEGLLVPTLADWLLFTHLIRFDAVESILFKANLRRVQDYQHLQSWLADLCAIPGVTETLKWPHIMAGGWLSRPDLNPKLRIPRGGIPFQPLPPVDRRMLSIQSSEQPQQTAAKKAKVGGEFVRPDSKLREAITADGSSGLKAEASRFHLYIANNCPWCHRVALTRAILGLEDAITMDVLFYRRDPDRGWQFKPEEPGCTPDTAAGGISFIRELYERQGSQEKSVPVLYDKQTRRIVNNESADIMRIFATAFKALHREGAPDLVPEASLPRIDAINSWVYTDINNGAYRAGFASEQGAYDVAFDKFFAALDRAEAILNESRFLCGDQVTEADVRLFPTLFRFDHIYYNRFLLNRTMIHDSYPALQRWLQDVWSLPGVAAASNLEHCKRGYFGRTGNNIVPLGPQLDWP